ncbi:Hypothetical predicted protein [Drosophila guanche]|uniref:Uncharacterized protein n=1 Tax=Drosophila guanche TaxID=7266 RepID=A0A3B0K1H1_DROGU|nr:Hypothetical predicted protein [Drosophila guanche]
MEWLMALELETDTEMENGALGSWKAASWEQPKMSNGDDVVHDDDDDDDNRDNVVLTLAPPEVACRKCQRSVGIQHTS